MKRVRKGLSIAMAACLFYTSAGISEAVSALVRPTSETHSAFLALPAELGQVTDSYRSSNTASQLILIQDLHGHYEAQKHIAGLLEWLAKKTPYVLAIEGASGPVDTALMASFPNKTIKHVAVDYLMREGIVSGAEYFAAMQGPARSLHGVEEQAAYTLHRELFRKTYAERERFVRLLEGMQLQIAALRDRTWKGNLKNFQRQWEALERGEMDLAEAVRWIQKTAEPLGIDVSSLQDIKESELAYDHIAALAFVLKTQLASTTQEKELVQIDHDVALLTRVASLQATEREVKSFGPRMNQFIHMAHALIEGTSPEQLRRLISSSIDYYALAMARNEPMVENTLRLLASADRSTAVLVAGGFHTAPITQILKQKQISYHVITPALTQVSAHDHALYIDRLRGKGLTVQQVMAASPELRAAVDIASTRGPRRNDALAIGITASGLLLLGTYLSASGLPINEFISRFQAYVSDPKVAPVLAQLQVLLGVGVVGMILDGKRVTMPRLTQGQIERELNERKNKTLDELNGVSARHANRLTENTARALFLQHLEWLQNLNNPALFRAAQDELHVHRESIRNLGLRLGLQQPHIQAFLAAKTMEDVVKVRRETGFDNLAGQDPAPVAQAFRTLVKMLDQASSIIGALFIFGASYLTGGVSFAGVMPATPSLENYKAHLTIKNRLEALGANFALVSRGPINFSHRLATLRSPTVPSRLVQDVMRMAKTLQTPLVVHPVTTPGLLTLAEKVHRRSEFFVIDPENLRDQDVHTNPERAEAFLNSLRNYLTLDLVGSVGLVEGGKPVLPAVLLTDAAAFNSESTSRLYTADGYLMKAHGTVRYQSDRAARIRGVLQWSYDDLTAESNLADIMAQDYVRQLSQIARQDEGLKNRLAKREAINDNQGSYPQKDIAERAVGPTGLATLLMYQPLIKHNRAGAKRYSPHLVEPGLEDRVEKKIKELATELELSEHQLRLAKIEAQRLASLDGPREYELFNYILNLRLQRAPSLKKTISSMGLALMAGWLMSHFGGEAAVLAGATMLFRPKLLSFENMRSQILNLYTKNAELARKAGIRFPAGEAERNVHHVQRVNDLSNFMRERWNDYVKTLPRGSVLTDVEPISEKEWRFMSLAAHYHDLGKWQSRDREMFDVLYGPLYDRNAAGFARIRQILERHEHYTYDLAKAGGLPVPEQVRHILEFMHTGKVPPGANPRVALLGGIVLAADIYDAMNDFSRHYQSHDLALGQVRSPESISKEFARKNGQDPYRLVPFIANLYLAEKGFLDIVGKSVDVLLNQEFDQREEEIRSSTPVDKINDRLLEVAQELGRKSILYRRLLRSNMPSSDQFSYRNHGLHSAALFGMLLLSNAGFSELASLTMNGLTLLSVVAASFLTRSDATRPQESNAGAKKVVLFAEDDPYFREMVKMMLEFDFEVIAVNDGSEALHVLQSGRTVDLLLTDLQMPVMGGDELILKAKALQKNLRVILLSAHTGVLRESVLAQHPDVVATDKPEVDPNKLTGLIKGMLKSPTLRVGTPAFPVAHNDLRNLFKHGRIGQGLHAIAGILLNSVLSPIIGGRLDQELQDLDKSANAILAAHGQPPVRIQAMQGSVWRRLTVFGEFPRMTAEQRAAGQIATAEINRFLPGDVKLRTLLHEHLHALHPDWSEAAVIEMTDRYLAEWVKQAEAMPETLSRVANVMRQARLKVNPADFISILPTLLATMTIQPKEAKSLGGRVNTARLYLTQA